MERGPEKAYLSVPFMAIGRNAPLPEFPKTKQLLLLGSLKHSVPAG